MPQDEKQASKTWWETICEIFGWTKPDSDPIKKVPKQNIEEVKND